MIFMEGLCRICGRTASNVCSLCGRPVCSQDYDRERGTCRIHRHGRNIEGKKG